jgi:thioredoxin reductase
MNYQVDVIIVGDSKVGHEILDKIAASKPTIKIAFISKLFKSTTTRDYLNVEYIRDNVIFTDYKNRLFGCYLESGTRIYGTHLIIASGLAYEPLMLATGKPALVGVYNNVDDVPKTSKNQPAVVVCNVNADVKFALDVAKKYKQVYLCVKDSTIEGLTDANAKKLEKTANIVVLPNTSLLKTISKDGVLLKAELNNYSMLNCSAIYAKTAASPDINFVSDKLVQKTEAGYLVTNENAESTLVPKLFAAGNCAQKYTKTMAQNLVEAVLKDF